MWPTVRRAWAGAGLLLLLAGPAGAQADSARPIRPPLVSATEAAAGGALILSAALFDDAVRRQAMADRSVRSNSIARAGNRFGTLQFAGPLLAAGWLTGIVVNEPSVSDASARALAAGAIAGGITAVLKVGFGRVRPRDGGDPDSFRPFTSNASFPSGHTTLAVAIATSLAHSTPDPWSDVALYGAAGLTGFARINDDKHWLSDVVGGALIGFLVGRRLHHRRDAGSVQPVVGPGGVGVAIPLGGPPSRRASRQHD